MAIARTPLLAVNPQVFDQEAYDELARLFADVRQSLTDQEITLTDGSTDGGFVSIGGDTMTGLLTLSGAPSSGLHAATKAYSDLKLLLTGGTMGGAIAMGTNKITGVVDPTADQEAATKKYVDDSLGGGVAKGWIRLDGTGTISIYDSFNVSGIVDTGNGAYTVLWDTDFANAN